MPLPLLEEPLVDPVGRRMEYLRLSITDACNFRCVYCLPDGWKPVPGDDEPLTVDEIGVLVRALSGAGLRKVRLTGGEPTVRRDLLHIVETVARVPSVNTVALSTNGWNLARVARPLRDAGLSAVNVSVDSLDRAEFASITGRDLLPRVLAGVEAALDAGLRVKLNTVHLREMNPGALAALLAYVQERPVTVRLIELMRTADNTSFFLRQHSPLEEVRAMLTGGGWALRARAPGDGPAEEYVHPRYAGGVGLIAPYSRDFCAGCNRLRVTSRGALRMCLFGDGNVPIRNLLRPGLEEDALATCRALLAGKPAAHRLHQHHSGSAANLSQMGG